MPSVLPIAFDCCCEERDCQPVPVQGLPGTDGEDGKDGIDGKDAFTETTSPFTTPAVGANVNVLVEDSEFLALLQTVFIENAGNYQVISKVSATEIMVKNLGGTGNVPAGSIIPVGSRVNTTGTPGVTGPPGPIGPETIRAVDTIIELKALPSNPNRKMVLVNFPEPPFSAAYKSRFGDATEPSEPAILTSNDGLTRYFEHTGIA